MRIENLGAASMEDVDAHLFCLQVKRGRSPTRMTDEDCAYVFEPYEAFSVARGDDFSAIRSPEKFWSYVNARKVPVIMTHRGGGMIWHGPGQAVLAPIVDLERARINLFSQYTLYLEETLIRTLEDFGVQGFRHPSWQGGRQGVWVKDRAGGAYKKIAFLGFRDSRGIVIHGCALNVSPNLYPFSLIDPCNLKGVAATSMKEVLGSVPATHAVAKRLGWHYEAILRTQPIIEMKKIRA